MSPNVSIIITTYNSAAVISACLRAVAALQFDGECEIIVVDNASHDESAALVAASCPHARLLREDENYGFAGAVNRGVAASQGEIVALLNPDAAPQPDWLQQIYAPFADAQTGIVGSKVLGPDDRIQSVGSTLQMPVLLTTHRGDGAIDDEQYHSVDDVWSVHGAAMAFSRRVWDALGGFDEGFFPAYWEESDFCERARRAGYRVIVAPRAVVKHHEATATGKYSAQFYFYYHRNRLRYAAKWLDWRTIWTAFRPAERARLAGAPLLDRRVARVVYEAGMPPLDQLGPTERAAVLATGQALRAGTLPDDRFAPLLARLHEAEANAVLEEIVFHSHIPLVARLRTAWNNVATRWYVRPNFERQTRANLALQRALAELLEQTTARAAADALDVALLSWRLDSLDYWPPHW